MANEETESSRQDRYLIEQVPYTEEQSPEFDSLIRSRERSEAPQDGLSEPTKDKLILSWWHGPCHTIISRTKDGTCQAFHVQPNKLAPSLLTFAQEKALKNIGLQEASAIVAKGERSWFQDPDRKELETMNIRVERIIDVNTLNSWRLVYDPENNELWIDIKDQKVLIKYYGFDLAEKEKEESSIT